MRAMPQISVVIVNYNVKYFLELCLYSVRQASRMLDVEVIVVDNNSQDGSCEMVRELFPEVKLIANRDNPGFGKANNQAIRVAKGQFVLLLNPDTIITENTLAECVEFMRSHAEAGALGVHMVSGEGKYLKESKRALPKPKVAFFKVFGLAGLFPRSTTFAKYHLGYLDKGQTHEVEILSGAFMFVRKQTLDEVGLFDEQFFMYGEDIDLSYRSILGGYRNYYLGGTRIIHFKGESTKKGSLNYVVVFYKAMEIFARKHFTGHGVSPIRLVIETAIWLRAFLAAAKRFFHWLVRPLMGHGRKKLSRSDKPVKAYVVTGEESFKEFEKDLEYDKCEFVRIDAQGFEAQKIWGLGAGHGPSQMVLLDMKEMALDNLVRTVSWLEKKNVQVKIVAPYSRVLVWGGMGASVQ